MKLANWIVNWTTRNLKWLLPFCLVMPFVLWWWNANIDRIGYWLWLALHGQKTDDLVALAVVGAVVLLTVFVLWLALLDLFGKERK